MQLQKLPVVKIITVGLVLGFCLIPALISETAGITKPPPRDYCEVRCWAQWHQCLGLCNRQGVSPNCPANCCTRLEICLWSCDEGLTEKVMPLGEGLLNTDNWTEQLTGVLVQ